MKVPRLGMGVVFLILGFLLIGLAFGAIPEGSLVLEGVGGVLGIGFLLALAAAVLVLLCCPGPSRRQAAVPARSPGSGDPRRNRGLRARC